MSLRLALLVEDGAVLLARGAEERRDLLSPRLLRRRLFGRLLRAVPAPRRNRPFAVEEVSAQDLPAHALRRLVVVQLVHVHELLWLSIMGVIVIDFILLILTLLSFILLCLFLLILTLLIPTLQYLTHLIPTHLIPTLPSHSPHSTLHPVAPRHVAAQVRARPQRPQPQVRLRQVHAAVQVVFVHVLREVRLAVQLARADVAPAAADRARAAVRARAEREDGARARDAQHGARPERAQGGVFEVHDAAGPGAPQAAAGGAGRQRHDGGHVGVEVGEAQVRRAAAGGLLLHEQHEVDRRVELALI